jgi:glycosyltransferase involved in cell wall biosynthesis
MEQQVLADADVITTVSPPLVEMLGELSGRPDAVHLIENGYDEADVVRHPPPKTQQFTITYTGDFSPLRRPDAFVQAVDLLTSSNRIPPDAWRVQFAGNNPPKYIPDRPPFRQLGYLSHQELNALRGDSDVLLLIMSDDPSARGNYSGKLFEYLACNRPVLAVARPDNVAAELIQQARAGRVVPHDPARIADAIAACYQAWQAGRFDHEPDWEIIHRFSRRNLTKRLADLFETLSSP